MSERRSWVFTIHSDPNELGPNKHHQRVVAWRLEQKWRKLARFAWCQAGSPVASCRVLISFIIRRGALLDACNATGSSALKYVVDGLKDWKIRGKLIETGMFADDSPDYVERGPVVQEPGRQWKAGNAHVVVIVEEIE